MSAIIIEGDLVHYEVLGRGKPIVFVHGWLGSWRYWLPIMQQLGIKYRCYALDLWGFGDSGKDPRRYSFEKQVVLLGQFIDRMGFPKSLLVGHGLGAALVAHYAAKAETAHKVHRMMIVSPPLLYDAPAPTTETSLTANHPHSDVGLALESPAPLTDTQMKMPHPDETVPSPSEKAAVHVQVHNPIKKIFNSATLPALLENALDTTLEDYAKLKALVAKTDEKAVHASVAAFHQVSTFRDVLQTQVPTLVVLGERDNLMPKPEDALMQQLNDRDKLKLLLMDTQHFPMIEDRTQFLRLLKDFIEAPDITTLTMKEEWVRRKR